MDKTTKLTPQILAMYLGGDAQTPQRHYPDPTKKSVHKIGKMMDLDLVLGQVGIWFEGEQKENLVNFYLKDIKPILRRLSSMTAEEIEQAAAFEGTSGGNEYDDIRDISKSVLYLLSKSFDLFGLIDSGEAIDSQTIGNG